MFVPRNLYLNEYECVEIRNSCGKRKIPGTKPRNDQSFVLSANRNWFEKDKSEQLDSFCSSLVNIEGEKLVIPNVEDRVVIRFNIITHGIYVNNEGVQKRLPIFYDNITKTLCVQSVCERGCAILLTHDRIWIGDTNYADLQRERKWTSAVNRLGKKIDEINELFDASYVSACHDSFMQVQETPCEPLDLLPVVEIRTRDKAYTLYPVTIKVHSSIKKGPLNKTSFHTDVITLDYDTDIVESFLTILLHRNLHSLSHYKGLLEKDVFTQHYHLSDYFGIGFFKEYFKQIIESDEYKALL